MLSKSSKNKIRLNFFKIHKIREFLQIFKIHKIRTLELYECVCVYVCRCVCMCVCVCMCMCVCMYVYALLRRVRIILKHAPGSVSIIPTTGTTYA